MSPVIWLSKISPCKLCASKTELPQGKQSRMSDSTVSVGQYSKLYVLITGWGLKPSSSGEMFLPSKCSSGVQGYLHYWELLFVVKW